MDLWRPVGFIIVFNDDFSVVNRLSGGRAYGVIVVAIVVLPDANVGQHVINIGDGDGVSVDVVADNFASMNPVAKWILIANMLFGRLEVFTLLVLFTPTFWRE